MLPRIHAKDFATVTHYLGVLLIITGLAMLLPLVVALAFNEYACACDYLFGAGLSCLAGALLRLFKPAKLDRRRSLLLCGIGWVVVAFFATMPLFLEGGFQSFLYAFFDSVSALTSTGVTTLQDVDHLSYSQTTWRTVLSLGGAQAIVLIGLYLGFFGDGGYSARDNARVRRDSTMASLRNTAQSMWRVLVIVLVLGTLAFFVLCSLLGFEPTDALMNAFWLCGNAFSTGSFVAHGSSLIFYHSSAVNAVAAVLMLLGSLSFAFVSLAMFRSHWSFKQLLRNSELRAFGAWLLVLAAAIGVLLCRDGIFTTLRGLFDHGAFMVVTAASTCGMQTVYPQQMGVSFGDGALLIIMAAMFVGGCSCSASGGLKMFRGLHLLRWFDVNTRRSLLPDSVQVTRYYWHFGRKRETSSDAMLAMVITTLFIIAAALGAAAFIAHGYPALDAIESSISYVTNTGMTMKEAPSTMQPDLVLVAMLLMWLGRLEFVALISVVVIMFGNLLNMPFGHRGKKSTARRGRKSLRARVSKNGRASGAAHAIVPLMIAAVLATTMASPVQAQAAKDDMEDSLGSAVEDVAPLVQKGEYRKYKSVSDILSTTARNDGTSIKFTGEVVGTAIRLDGSHSIVNLSDEEGNSVGVVVENEVLEEIDDYGKYGKHGTVLRVKGTLNQACGTHADELDVHAVQVKVVQESYEWEETPDNDLAFKGAVLALLAALLSVFERIWRGKKRGTLFGFAKKQQRPR